jgi:hypothetical protein
VHAISSRADSRLGTRDGTAPEFRGETHPFTDVKKFGGGFIYLNAASGQNEKTILLFPVSSK